MSIVVLYEHTVFTKSKLHAFLLQSWFFFCKNQASSHSHDSLGLPRRRLKGDGGHPEAHKACRERERKGSGKDAAAAAAAV